MREGISYTGVPSADELRNCRGIPSRERMEAGPVAVVECIQCIPCNPCESACPFGAIKVGSPMTNAPVLDEARCVGCGSCIAKCPGLAITVINLNDGDGLAALDFPYEYLPLPHVGQTVTALDRMGQPVCQAAVTGVDCPKAYNKTTLVTLAVPEQYQDTVRFMQRLPREEASHER